MKTIYPFLTTLTLFLISYCISAQSVQLVTDPNALPLYESDKIYVKVKNDSNEELGSFPVGIDSSLLVVINQYGVTNIEKPFQALNTPTFDRTYRVSFTDTINIDSFMSDVAAVVFIEYAEKIPIDYTTLTPIDPALSGGDQYYWNLINANGLFDIHQTNPGDAGNAIVAIVDDAVQLSHEDLAANTTPTPFHWDAADSDSDPNPPFWELMLLMEQLIFHTEHM